MNVQPPKHLLSLALYCLAIYLLMSFVWDVLLHLPTEKTSGVTFVMFLVIGYFYGKRYGVLSLKKSLLVTLYFIIPVFALHALPLIHGYSDIPRTEIVSFLLLAMLVTAMVLGIQLICNAVGLYLSSSFAVKGRLTR